VLHFKIKNKLHENVFVDYFVKDANSTAGDQLLVLPYEFIMHITAREEQPGIADGASTSIKGRPLGRRIAHVYESFEVRDSIPAEVFQWGAFAFDSGTDAFNTTVCASTIEYTATPLNENGKPIGAPVIPKEVKVRGMNPFVPVENSADSTSFFWDMQFRPNLTAAQWSATLRHLGKLNASAVAAESGASFNYSASAGEENGSGDKKGGHSVTNETNSTTTTNETLAWLLMEQGLQKLAARTEEEKFADALETIKYLTKAESPPADGGSADPFILVIQLEAYRARHKRNPTKRTSEAARGSDQGGTNGGSSMKGRRGMQATTPFMPASMAAEAREAAMRRTGAREQIIDMAKRNFSHGISDKLALAELSDVGGIRIRKLGLVTSEVEEDAAPVLSQLGDPTRSLSQAHANRRALESTAGHRRELTTIFDSGCENPNGAGYCPDTCSIDTFFPMEGIEVHASETARPSACHVRASCGKSISALSHFP
jgi:hypothetical protein